MFVKILSQNVFGWAFTKPSVDDTILAITIICPGCAGRFLLCISEWWATSNTCSSIADTYIPVLVTGKLHSKWLTNERWVFEQRKCWCNSITDNTENMRTSISSIETTRSSEDEISAIGNWMEWQEVRWAGNYRKDCNKPWMIFTDYASGRKIRCFTCQKCTRIW